MTLKTLGILALLIVAVLLIGPRQFAASIAIINGIERSVADLFGATTGVQAPDYKPPGPPKK
jgi:hypothetical protein